MNTYIQNLISQGEHQTQDFKFCINDSRKIAKSLVAFANTDGGRLLIGVKDNGNIAGVRSEEEYYMVEAAAKIYSKPQINFESKQWNIEGKSVLEIIINPGADRPYYAKDENGKWLAYFRRKDENILANGIMLEVWRKEKNREGILIRYSAREHILLDLLQRYETVSLHHYAQQAHIPLFLARKILINFILLNIIKIDTSDKKICYKLNEKFDVQKWEEVANKRVVIKK
ncbi:MAG: putative DNA binding domain-containing protein [Bacteroidota bacterium]|nr:putative DNA binding domain-containing protein [Bacteroidota bacterium]MDP4204880.1 putative DNA binding domain-containing protein [Bacteroidota bacterium]